MALIVCGSALGGFVARNVMPLVATLIGNASTPMIVQVCSLFLLGAAAAVVYVKKARCPTACRSPPPLGDAGDGRGPTQSLPVVLDWSIG